MNKVAGHLGDRAANVEFDENLINSFSNELNAQLKAIQNHDKLSLQDYLHLRSSAAAMSRFYGLEKPT